MKGYDFGGAEYPYDSSITVVDKVSTKEWQRLVGSHRACGEVFRNQYIRADIGTPLNLEPVNFINVSRVLRYAHCPSGFLYSRDPVKINKLLIAASNIDRCLNSGGKARLFDHVEVLGVVVDDLLSRGYALKKVDCINPRDEDYPGEWLFILRKPL